MQKADIAVRKRIRKLVREFIRLDMLLRKLAITLRSFRGSPYEVRKAYFDATIKSPERAADQVWLALADGEKTVDFFEMSLMDLHPDAQLFHVADAILNYCKEKDWGEQVESVLSEDAKALLAERRIRRESLVRLSNGREQAHV